VTSHGSSARDPRGPARVQIASRAAPSRVPLAQFRVVVTLHTVRQYCCSSSPVPSSRPGVEALECAFLVCFIVCLVVCVNYRACNPNAALTVRCPCSPRATADTAPQLALGRFQVGASSACTVIAQALHSARRLPLTPTAHEARPDLHASHSMLGEELSHRRHRLVCRDALSRVMHHRCFDHLCLPQKNAAPEANRAGRSPRMGVPARGQASRLRP